MGCSPFHYAWLFLTHIINSFKAIIAWNGFFSSFSMKYIVLKSSCIFKCWWRKKSILALSKVFFHNTLKIRSILIHIKTRSISFATYEVSNKNWTILFVHFANFNWSIYLDYYKKYNIDWSFINIFSIGLYFIFLLCLKLLIKWS